MFHREEHQLWEMCPYFLIGTGAASILIHFNLGNGSSSLLPKVFSMTSSLVERKEMCMGRGGERDKEVG